mgnify:CR=1 FL=1
MASHALAGKPGVADIAINAGTLAVGDDVSTFCQGINTVLDRLQDVHDHENTGGKHGETGSAAFAHQAAGSVVFRLGNAGVHTCFARCLSRLLTLKLMLVVHWYPPFAVSLLR